MEQILIQPISLKTLHCVLNNWYLIITYLDWAALNGRTAIIELLLEFKSDPNIKNEFDHIAFEEALQNGFTEAAVILKCTV